MPAGAGNETGDTLERPVVARKAREDGDLEAARRTAAAMRTPRGAIIAERSAIATPVIISVIALILGLILTGLWNRAGAIVEG